MASFPTFLKDNRGVCSTVTVVSEARNKLASNKTKITKMSSVLTKLGREIGQEKAKESKNTELINGLVTEYTGVKETIYGLISELLTSSEEFNTSLELRENLPLLVRLQPEL